MKYFLKIKPYGESQDGHLINFFDDHEWDSVIDLFETIINNFKKKYTELEFKHMEHYNGIIEILFMKKGKIISDHDLEEYADILCGYNLDNVLYFDNKEYYIRGDIMIKKSKELDYLEKHNMMLKDISPELVSS